MLSPIIRSEYLGQISCPDFGRPSLSTPKPPQKNGIWSLCKQYAHSLYHIVGIDNNVPKCMVCPKALHPLELARLQEVIDAFPPRPVADFLFSVFTKHATDTFFYFDQAQFLTELDRFYSDSNSSLRFDAAFVCLAMATFALASQWTPMEEPESTGAGERRSNADLGRVFYCHARTLIPDIIDRPCLRSIQAPFVLGVYLLPASAVGSSYVYMGLALRKALASDLHLRSDDQGIDDREREIRRRLWWSIYSLERLVRNGICTARC